MTADRDSAEGRSTIFDSLHSLDNIVYCLFPSNIDLNTVPYRIHTHPESANNFVFSQTAASSQTSGSRKSTHTFYVASRSGKGAMAMDDHSGHMADNSHAAHLSFDCDGSPWMDMGADRTGTWAGHVLAGVALLIWSVEHVFGIWRWEG